MALFEIAMTYNTCVKVYEGLSHERCKSSLYVASKKYNVILIEWSGLIAERIGFGEVEREAVFKSCHRPMEWEEILLE